MTSIKYFYLVLILAVLSLEGCMLKQVSKEPAKTEKDNNIAYQNPEKIIPLSKEVADDIFRLTSLAKFDERFVIPAAHREEAIEMLQSTDDHKGNAGFGFNNGVRRVF